MRGARIIRNTTYIFMISLIFALTTGMYVYGSQQGQAEQKEIHVAVTGSDVAGKGTQDAPYATVSAAARLTHLQPACGRRSPSSAASPQLHLSPDALRWCSGKPC